MDAARRDADLMGWAALPVPPAQLGESPLWHPAEQVLYWCDIAGNAIHRWRPQTQQHDAFDFAGEPACIAPLLDVRGAGLLVAARHGLWRLDTTTGQRQKIAEPPYDSATQRFNDGKADPLGRLWVSTVHDARAPHGALWRWDAAGGFARMADGITTGNGLAIAPDARSISLADTAAHTLWRYALDLPSGSLAQRRVWGQWAPKPADGDLARYGGRPDGAAMDSEGALWIALYEGARVQRIGPDGRVLQELPVPVRCPTMPCFGGGDLRTLYLSTARKGRPAVELAREPLAGAVFSMRVEVPGLPAHFARA